MVEFLLHLDRVETLGGFGEIEAVLSDGNEKGASDGADSSRAAVDDFCSWPALLSPYQQGSGLFGMDDVLGIR